VVCRAKKNGIAFTKEGNCLTHISDAAGLARVADTLSAQPTIGHLNQLCAGWVYTCLSLALDSEEQAASEFPLSVFDLSGEYSHKLLFRVVGQMEEVLQA
jgi:hypothetical protein